MNLKIRELIGISVAGIALSACGDSKSLSGEYVGDVMGSQMVINFIDDSKATFNTDGDDDSTSLDCTYQVGETLITLSCFGSSGISLTRVDGGLEANMGGMLVRYTKR